MSSDDSIKIYSFQPTYKLVQIQHYCSHSRPMQPLVRSRKQLSRLFSGLSLPPVWSMGCHGSRELRKKNTIVAAVFLFVLWDSPFYQPPPLTDCCTLNSPRTEVDTERGAGYWLPCGLNTLYVWVELCNR